MTHKYVYDFAEGSADMRTLLGGKGANLAEMTRADLPVPPGFTITTEACHSYFRIGSRITAELERQYTAAMDRLERQTGRSFGDPDKPLLVSVRSGSVASMPGMMDTILNLGLNDATVLGLAKLTGNGRFAYDCYRRLVQMFGSVVLGIDGSEFEMRLHRLKARLNVDEDRDVTAEGWQSLIEDFKDCIGRRAGREFPQNVRDQLRMAVEAVFKSWHNPRARVYRKLNRIPDSQGTAVNVQSMVFGNMGDDCGTGVLFTRNPATGEDRLFGEFLINAQGEDVVAGIRTPLPIEALKQSMPAVFEQLAEAAKRLERHYKDMQDIEFTVQNNRLYLLQTRSGKRNAQAALKIAVDLVKENVLTKREALMRIEVSHLDQLLHRGLKEEAVRSVLATGLAASPGAAVGQIVFHPEKAVEWSKQGKRVILARPETTPEDIQGLIAAEGILTSRGGLTSHAAVVARGMGKPCVCGCEALRINLEAQTMEAGEAVIREGDWITLDGATGRVMAGEIPVSEAVMTEELRQMLAWADELRTLKVYANADNPQDAEIARRFGAQGIGLCRTEHMFFSPRRLPIVREMILADSREARRASLAKLLPMQEADFRDMFAVMAGLPVTIRLLDPPLHEFLPNLEELQQKLVRMTYQGEGTADEQAELKRMIRRVRGLHEANPMLGQRGCRLGIVYPEIYDMQIEAVFRAVSACMDKGTDVRPEIMIPLVGHASELKLLREMVDRIAEQVLGKHKSRECRYKVGTMIEVPRAALTADQIAAHSDFFSFGTNDLTQMTLGYSRDDAENKFMAHYMDRELLPSNPFQVLDTEGVGRLIDMAVSQGRAVKSQLKTGVCGEHGGDGESIAFCHRAGLDYVSCSPYRIPLARIAAAQAAVQQQTAGQEEQTAAFVV